jgi:hypothetical protein
MGISEVCSPISRKGSKVGSSQPLSPGARSMPGASDSVPEQKTEQRRHDHEQGEEPEQSPVEPHVHVHGVDPDPEAKGDSLGVMQRLANRIMGRDRRAEPGYTFRNFPTD